MRTIEILFSENYYFGKIYFGIMVSPVLGFVFDGGKPRQDRHKPAFF